jgi:hypothetical protein
MSEPKPANDAFPNAIIVPFQSTAGRAVEIKAQIASHLQEICAQIDEAKRLGLMVEFNVGPDAFGKTAVTRLFVALAY